MKKLLSVLTFLMFPVVFASLVKAQDYDGSIFEEKIPVNRESRSLYFKHDSVKWGGKKFAWGSNLSIRFRGHYSKSSPRFFIRDKTTRLISNNKKAHKTNNKPLKFKVSKRR